MPVAILGILKWYVDRHKTFDILKTKEDFIAIDGNTEKAATPIFEHQLLKKDWMPTFHILPQDQEEYEKAKKDPAFGKLLRELLYGNSERRRKREKRKMPWSRRPSGDSRSRSRERQEKG